MQPMEHGRQVSNEGRCWPRYFNRALTWDCYCSYYLLKNPRKIEMLVPISRIIEEGVFFFCCGGGGGGFLSKT